MCGKRNMETYIIICKMDSQWEFAVCLRKPKSGALYQPRGVEWGDIYIYISLLLLLLSCFSCVRPCATPETAAHQAPPSLGFSRQEHWSGLPFPSPMHESEK